MKLLLDSHTLLWAVDNPARLSHPAAASLRQSAIDLFISAATFWEMAIKVSVKKLALSLPYKQWMNQAISTLGLAVLPVTIDYADVQASLPFHHRDPFDRLLVAQALCDNIPIVSSDNQLDPYGITRIW